MRRDKLFKLVVTIIADQFAWDSEHIQEHTELEYDLCGDYSDLNELALRLEEAFDVKMLHNIGKFVTISDLVDYIEERL